MADVMLQALMQQAHYRSTLPQAAPDKCVSALSDCSTSALTERTALLSEDFSLEALPTSNLDDLLGSTLDSSWTMSSLRAELLQDVVAATRCQRFLEIKQFGEHSSVITAEIDDAATAASNVHQYRVWRSSGIKPTKSALLHECVALGEHVDVVLLAVDEVAETDFQMLWNAEGLLSEESIVCIDLRRCREGCAAAFTEMIMASPDKVCFEAENMLIVQRSHFPGPFAA